MGKTEIILSARDTILSLTVSDVHDEELMDAVSSLIRSLNDVQQVLRFPVRGKK